MVFETVPALDSETLLRQIVGLFFLFSGMSSSVSETVNPTAKKETNTYDLEVKGSRFKSYRLSRPPSYSIPNSVDPPDPFNTHQYTAKFVTTTNWSNALQVQMVHSHQGTPIFTPHCTMNRDQSVIRSFLCVDDRMRPFKSIKQPRVETGTP